MTYNSNGKDLTGKNDEIGLIDEIEQHFGEETKTGKVAISKAKNINYSLS